MTLEFVTEIAGIIFTAGGVYGAIRADLKMLHFKADEAKKEADEAHRRLDLHLQKDHS